MRCSELLAAYLAELPLGVILTDEQISRHLKRAIRFYCGFATLVNAPSAFEQAQAAATAAGLLPPLFPVPGQAIHSPVSANNLLEGDQDFDLSPSEYTLIRPLFELYVELEGAVGQESSRSVGIEQYGRSSAEVQAQITQAEEDMPKKAFYSAVVTI